ncbi:sigma-54-dependent Fis family transcriptional regulator [Nocardioides immobilis]|uniref:sigma-54-dependent Fis family transcriptional regulator n=1 Tax=Nocardioides immobilis TaxID=2049295 RepID=UPI0015FA572D|nr:helix-turn-helix domain-containing protein [Nocardioides immobilis]
MAWRIMNSPSDGASGSTQARPEIELSWKRSVLNGITPELQGLDELPVIDIDPSSRLLTAASPVLDQMVAKLTGTNYSLLLADRDCRLMYRWFDEPKFETVMDSLGLRHGANIGEDSVGTNALGTAIETRHGIVVHGTEHYIESFKRFSCYGHPIRHPVTRRIEGVLDITGIAADANPLLAPFLVRAVEDIEQRLLDQAKASERALLAAFQSASRHRQRAVAALGDDIVLTNKAALDLLEPGDYALMRMLMDDLERTPERSAEVSLSSGASVHVHLARVAGAGEGTMFHFEPVAEPRLRSPRAPVIPVGDAGTPLLIHGSPGTGRSTEARRIFGDSADYFNCADAAMEGEMAFGRRLRDRLANPAGSVCLENVELLPDALVPVVVESIDAGKGPRLGLTTIELEELRGAHLGLATMIVERIELKPLRNRGAEVSEIAMRLIRELNPAANVRLIPSVIESLATRPWPGNLHELKAVLAHVVQHRSAGDVTLTDLPEAYRTSSGARQLWGREQAEHDAILAALRRCDGNKVKAAQELGISRTTLYARIRALKITGF